MDPRTARAVVAVTTYVVLAASGLTALVRGGADGFAVLVLGVAATAGLAVALTHVLGRTTRAARRLVGDTLVIADANMAHRLDPEGAADLAPLAAAVNRLAEAREAAATDATGQAEAARSEVEAERNRLAALMAQLTVAVVVCNSEGRILLYNEAARALVDDASLLGLGRSVFGVVDRGLVAHAYDRLRSGAEPVYTATTVHRDRQLRVEVTLVGEPEIPDTGDATEGPRGLGFVLVLEDLTRQVLAGDRRESLLRQLTEGTRASLGSIRAAVETVLEFPEMTAQERRRFLEVASQEADRLGRQVEQVSADAHQAADDRLLTEIAGEDVLAVVGDEIGRHGLECRQDTSPADVWVRADVHALARVVAHLATHLDRAVTAGAFSLLLTPADAHAQLDVRWRGRAPLTSVVDGWLDEPLDGPVGPTARQVADRHGAEVWCGDLDADNAYLRVLLPLAGEERAASTSGPLAPSESRPEFYDFDLFTARPQPADLADRRLDDLVFTVLDTETTGLDPDGGDRVVSIGAVRVVNGRVLTHETFERLVQPQRSVPLASTAIHGITAQMVEGQPTIDEVLPAFLRFCEDTVLVGHNVGFDLRFLTVAAGSCGIELPLPALDTLLLHAALHPEHEDHTLDAIAHRLGVSVVGRHTALGDALVTAEVFVALTALLRPRGIDTLGAALAASRTTFEARVDERLYGG